MRWFRTVEKERGVLCGCDAEQEWLLAWWWGHYSATNAFPVTFIDLGMTEEGRRFCQERGELLSVPIDNGFVKRKEQLSSETAAIWEAVYGPTVWPARLRWFKKPFALLHSNYRSSLWLDLDCEVLGPLDALFAAATDESQLALVREYATEHLPLFDPGILYNGGVIAFLHGVDVLTEWAAWSLEKTGDFWSDDAMLSALIYSKALRIVELPDIYNWRLPQGVNIHAVIHHWAGSAGKAYIRRYDGLKATLQQFFKSA